MNKMKTFFAYGDAYVSMMGIRDEDGYCENIINKQYFTTISIFNNYIAFDSDLFKVINNLYLKSVENTKQADIFYLWINEERNFDESNFINNVYNYCIKSEIMKSIQPIYRIENERLIEL